MPDDYVTIGKYFDSVDAELTRIKLEAARIPCFLADGAVAGQPALDVSAEGPATVNYEG